MTGTYDASKNNIAIKQIKKRFENSKKVQVGINKGSEYPGVVAEKVIDFLPFQ